MDYKVEPGLYGLGQPDPSSPVLVTANYKLSFDHLRGALPELSAWILVLDTAGINVWCAAGKGTFGTEELVERVRGVGLDRIVDHRDLVLPQLGAVGVAGHQVTRATGFKVHWGPVEARDLPAWLARDRKASPQMRTKGFPLSERLALVPMEVVGSFKWSMTATALVLALGWALGGSPWSGVPMAVAVAMGVLGGGVAMPLLLPWLPGRPFALKGAWTGILAALLPAWLARGSWLEAAGVALVTVAWSSFLALNFTGASILTSLSGVRREMRVAIPTLAVGALLGLAAWIAGLLLA